jgi:hypothetical protein
MDGGIRMGALINPHAPNSTWADGVETIAALAEAGLITCEGAGLDGWAWLRNREVGEAAGEFVFGPAANPLRGTEILLPRACESLFCSTGVLDDKTAGSADDPKKSV